MLIGIAPEYRTPVDGSQQVSSETQYLIVAELVQLRVTANAYEKVPLPIFAEQFSVALGELPDDEEPLPAVGAGVGEVAFDGGTFDIKTAPAGRETPPDFFESLDEDFEDEGDEEEDRDPDEALPEYRGTASG